MEKVSVDHVLLVGAALDEEFRGFISATYGDVWCIWVWPTEALRIRTNNIQMITSTIEKEEVDEDHK